MTAVRKRLACVECTRRKIRCDKVVPCRNCTRRGTPCTRSKESKSDSLVERLQARVQQLEAAVLELSQPHSQPRKPSITPAPDDTGERDTEPDAEIGDAATILEFLAWGRRKNPDYGDSMNVHSPGDVTAEPDGQGMGRQTLSPGPDRASAEAYLQLLLPRRALTERLVAFHYHSVLWYHGSYDGNDFQDELDAFYRIAHGNVGHHVDLQWLALLFAVLCGALSCAPRRTAESWGIRAWEQTSLAQRWFKAVSTCLHHADFTACHSLYAIQAVGTLTMSAHLLGFSNSLSVLIASAARIGQCLGMQHRELGGAWRQLCIQDWFSIPFFESYLIPRPKRINPDDEGTGEDTPTHAAYSTFFYKVAAVMASLHNSTTSTQTLYTRYEQVLEHDRQLRVLATTGLPAFLQNVPIEPAWPTYVPWARRCLAISLSHKVIMIHRKFLALSFRDPIFLRTRRTCVAAARTIIKEQKEARADADADAGVPVLWIMQAFGVTAGIILCLDLFHRPRSADADSEATYHRQLINDALKMLADGPANMIAKRGVHLLEALLAREPRASNELDLGAIVKGVCEQTSPCAATSVSPSLVRNRERLREDGDSMTWPPAIGSSPGYGNGLRRELHVGTGYTEEKETLEGILSLAASYI
ncbi:uncharacterized protein DSM5745_05776 [Aspergillus mulundensis]|uniref:Zn(2)-C6 fungal-type domain-containing protein n=1 Tax=Aspergillus mulundensis TaxID=1810919 RepID=A0A3D8RYJ0_9EURO|nr:hypothetical protein DSM5745_05776 [Aspergillus mulundensis]RDW78924.1 hypothetical protein DSM5745_05776 [Aspergillus mulundensis]